MPFFSQCGAKCDDSFRFCNNCGNPLATADSGAAEPPPPATPPRQAPKSTPVGSSSQPLQPGDQVRTLTDGMQMVTHAPQKTGLVCALCHKDITSESYAIMALGKRFHKECFKCNRCGQRLFSFAKFFQDDNGMPLCAKCNTQDMPRCSQCGKPVTGRYIVAAGKSFHPECCVCAGCGQPFGPEGFFEDGGKLWHINCAH